MATSSAINNEPVSGASAAKVDMKFEVVVIPVTDVDRSKAFLFDLMIVFVSEKSTKRGGVLGALHLLSIGEFTNLYP